MATNDDGQATLPALIGAPAVAHSRRAVAYVLIAFAFGWVAMMPVWVWAAVTRELAPRIISAIAIAATVALLGKATVEARRSGRKASEYASRSLGYPIRIGCYGAGLDSWQRAIWRARVYHDLEIKRPRVVWSTRFEERRLGAAQQIHDNASKASG